MGFEGAAAARHTGEKHRGLELHDVFCTPIRFVQEDDEEGKNSDEDAAVDVLFNDDGSRNVPCRCVC